MATSLVQKARQQKLIYFGAIVVLFTLSLVHREFVINPQAIRLQLKETSRGEVELTSSAVRLLLTGSRGLAVTMLWYNAMEKQKRNEWHDLELLVKSITKLQPYFITPWLYQSWNLSFNVAVECDRPRDKYYYIGSGLELLAEGERRNRGTDFEGAVDPDRPVFPGNPELRHFMGFTYQLKIGSSDERLTMRSLLEMSCIDPLQRDPKKFRTSDEKTGRETVNFAELARFYQRYPRLARRLHEQLGLAENPRQFIQFLEEYQNIPSRFEPVDKSRSAQIEASDLKAPNKQVPILPPPEAHWPDPRKVELTTTESVDVFLVSRTWYEFAMKPLPPADAAPRDNTPSFDRSKYRGPKQMVIQLFRAYVARAQVFIAETLESEGFFDDSGWSDRKMQKWFRDNLRRPNAAPEEFTFGSDAKFHSRLAWKQGHRLYRQYGEANGIYIEPRENDRLNKAAELARKKFGIQPGEPMQARPGKDELGASIDAHERLRISEYYRRLSNFDTYFYQSEGEGDLITVGARKMLFSAERSRKANEVVGLLETYRGAWDLFMLACFKYPKFAQVSSVQEDVYETYVRYLETSRKLAPEIFRRHALWGAKLQLPDTWLQAVAAYHVVTATERDVQAMQKTLPRSRNHRGELDKVQYYDGPAAKEVKEWLTDVLNAVSLSTGARPVYFPAYEYMLLTRMTPFTEDTAPANWRHIINPETRETAADRLNLPR
jgi:hypothetical protein